ncbi:MAG: hypothetical protein M1818_007473 [Claussenomyces sp. TS43310]|nr:MAG: hypothetical protein M1818_007473 [Claussenomyces sp. TS43310]
MSASHGFNLQQSGAVFTAMIVGSLLATVLSIYQERFSARLFSRWTARAPHGHNPEQRLYFSCLESALLPIGLFWFGWSQFASVHWIVPSLGIGCATMGIFSVYLATFNYLADTYHRFASSALAAQSCCRNLLGGAFPLVTTALFNNLGFGPAASLLGGLATILTVVPWVLIMYGPTIRARSKFAREIM